MNNKQKITLFLFAIISQISFLAFAQAPVVASTIQNECVKPFGKDSIETRKNFFLFQESFKSKDFDEAYTNWTYVFVEAPCAFKSTLKNGRSLINNLLTKYKDNPVRKKGLIDTLFMTYPLELRLYGNDPKIKGEWANSLIKYQPTNLEKINENFGELYAFEKDNMSYTNVFNYMKNSVELNKLLKMKNKDLFDLYSNLSNTCDVNINNENIDSISKVNWSLTSKNLDRFVTPLIKCLDIDNLYKDDLKSNPDDAALMMKLIKLYKNGKCTNNPNYVSLLEKKFALSPDPIAAEELAKFFETTKNNAKANEYYEKVLNMSKDNTQKAAILVKLVKQTNGASGNVNRLLEVDPNNALGVFYKGVNIYKSASGCSTFDRAAAACEAVSYFERAKTLTKDAKLIAEINKQIAAYKRNFPSKQEMFFRSLKSGDSYRIECLGITTILRQGLAK